MYLEVKDMKRLKMGGLCLNVNALNVESLKRNSSNRRETGQPVERGGLTRYSSIDWY